MTKAAKIAVAVGALAAAAAAGTVAVVSQRPAEKHEVVYSAQVVLPFALSVPVGVALDSTGNSYVADYYTTRSGNSPRARAPQPRAVP